MWHTFEKSEADYLPYPIFEKIFTLNVPVPMFWKTTHLRSVPAYPFGKFIRTPQVPVPQFPKLLRFRYVYFAVLEYGYVTGTKFFPV